jgi:hypothetical protein
MSAKLVSGSDLLRAFGVAVSDIRQPKPDTEDPAELFRWAIRNVKVDGGNGPRSMEYYAGVGIDHFGHRWDALEELVEAIAAELKAPS